MGLRDGQQAVYLWVSNKNDTWYNRKNNSGSIGTVTGTITIKNFTSNTSYIVERWDTLNGTILNTSTLTANGSGEIQVSVQNLVNDTAFKIYLNGYFETAVTPTPTPTSTHCTPLGDINCSGKVDIMDLSAFLSNFGSTSVTSDLNNNGKVDISDLSILLSNFGKSS
jgi:hypothetical protein